MRKIMMLLAVATVAWAGGYGTAGCGLGALVIGDAPGIVQIFAATTNGTSGSQTFGITSGTSNCAEDGVALQDRQLEMFAEANFETLLQEMAQGEGEVLFTMASLMGCEGERATDLADLLKDNYENVVLNNSDARSLTQNVRLVGDASGVCNENGGRK